MQRFADKLKPFRVSKGHRQQEQGAKPSQPHEEGEKQKTTTASKLHIYDFKGRWIKGMEMQLWGVRQLQQS